VLTEPNDLDRVELRAFLERHWRLENAELEYLPVGFGSDLRMVLHEDLTGWDNYIGAAGDTTLSREAIELYRRWWELADVTTFVDVCRRKHVQTRTRFKILGGSHQLPVRYGLAPLRPTPVPIRAGYEHQLVRALR
jgi:hypothetical protein